LGMLCLLAVYLTVAVLDLWRQLTRIERPHWSPICPFTQSTEPCQNSLYSIRFVATWRSNLQRVTLFGVNEKWRRYKSLKK
jgi:hypothetical protein